MIISVFWALLVITIVLIFIGVAYEYPEAAIIGFGFLFLLGVVFLTTGLEYKIGESFYSEANVTGNYTLTEGGVTYLFEDYTSHYIGFFLCIMGVAGFVASLLNVRRAKES